MDLEKNYEGKNHLIIKKAVRLVDNNFKHSERLIAELLNQFDIRNPESFTFAKDKDLGAKMNKVIGVLSTNIEKAITEASIINWGLANQKNDLLTTQYLRSVYGATDIKKSYFSLNVSAMNEFIQRTEDGMNLSARVWDITNNFKAQLETYVGTGITAGRSVSNLSQDIRLLLRKPQALFRRVRNAKGNLVLSKAAEDFHPGTGVYRSAYKNALRLTATETNMAYRVSDYTRRQQLDFVMGFRVHLSNSHATPDICNHMAGDYPKEFKYRGWHPWCLCFTTSILMSGSEFKRMKEKGTEPMRMIKTLPMEAKDFLRINSEFISAMNTKPYFVSDNPTLLEYVAPKT